MFWYEYKGPEKDVFVSSRVRLARNIVDYPFGERLDDACGREIAERVKKALSQDCGYTFTEFSTLAEKEKISLVENHRASPEMLRARAFSAIAENEEKSVSVLIGEEDHIRIQAIRSGLDLSGAREACFEAEGLIDKNEKFAYSEKLGYLTHCPTNLGTGMRASVMMFLPMLTRMGRMEGVRQSLHKIGLTVRGESGEGSAARGDLYQISNRTTLGVSEEEIINNLNEAANAVAREERALREKYITNGTKDSEDRIMRSLGIMKYARIVDTQELYRLYSDVRLGISCGLIKGDESELDRLLISCLPANLCILAGADLSASERDIERAKRLRQNA
ncbi:MAG: ATP--guanido phosphotransferase [Ruminococcaceae bacterium]|nr:ATP--guanido phosphotransferase [Oscillospiraceae bacterium]